MINKNVTDAVLFWAAIFFIKLYIYANKIMCGSFSVFMSQNRNIKKKRFNN